MKSWNDDFLDAGRDIYYPIFEASKAEWYDNRAGSDLSRWESYDAFLTLNQEQGCGKILELKAAEENRALYVKILRVFHAFAGGYLRKRRLTQDSNLPAFKGGMLYSNYERLAQKALYPYRRNRQYDH